MRHVATIVVVTALLVAACGGSGPSADAFCKQMSNMGQIDQELLEVELSDSDAVTAAVQLFREEFTKLAEVSPDEVAADSEIVARFGVTAADALLQLDPDDPFDRAAVLAAATASEPDLEQALERLATYTARRCTPAPGS